MTSAVGGRPLGVPVSVRAYRGEILQRGLAAAFAILLVVAPFARPLAPVELAAHPAASPEALVAHHDAQSGQPVAGVPPAQPFTAGILSRLSLLERALGLPPVKPPLLRPAVDQIVLAQRARTALGAEPGGVLQRSSVGTARTPTGPPA
jgi:hypothetical protein